MLLPNLGMIGVRRPQVKRRSSVGQRPRVALNQRDIASQRLAAFLHRWYKPSKTVVTAGEVLELSRSYVAHTIQPQALALVAKRFLELARRVEASA
jgi:hypothetical protein